MAQQCPASVDVTDIQFKLQSKHIIYRENGKLRDHVNLLACASNYGLLFVGNPNAPELNAFILPDVIYAKSKGQPVHLRTVKLANVPNTVACNADGSMLAVNYTVQGYGAVEIYSVQSFAASADIKPLYSMRLPDQIVYALQLLWNPVIPAVIGVVLSDGTFVLYTLKDGGAIEMRSIKNQQIQCGCWSPKGKQIVLGHPNGKLQQFKPDLSPVKSIVCPPDVHPGPFDTIALHWLSTFQFVVSYLQQGEGTFPNIYIVNAPKGGTTTYINYNDVCYSGSEPRKQQITFVHIAQWNLILVTSANGVEIGLLGTKDTRADQPQWIHYMLLDEARIEMPLTEASEETYPIGLALDTSPTHQLTVGERKLQTMPVVHVLSSNGHLLCFNFLNLMENAASICSQPVPINYEMSAFKELDEENFRSTASNHYDDEQSNQAPTIPKIEEPPPAMTLTIPPISNVSGQNITTYGTVGGKPTLTVGWEQKQQNLNFGSTTFVSDAQRNVISEPAVQTVLVPTATSATKKPTHVAEVFKPLYTVLPEFAPPPIQQQQQQHESQKAHDDAGKSMAQQLHSNEMNSVIQQMIAMQILTFEKEIKQLGQKSKLVLNEDLSTMKSYSKRLINLVEILEQANERDFVMDVQDLRHSLNESYEMLNECRSKLKMYKNPEDIGLKYITLNDCVSQRQLKALQNHLAVNQNMMKSLEQQIDAQWSYYQDTVRRNSKSHNRLPCLDGIYQQMTKLKNLLTQQQTHLLYIKSVMKQKELGCGRLRYAGRKNGGTCAKSDGSLVSLADSILSMSIHNMTDAKSSRLPENKLNYLRNFTKQQGRVTMIKPQRPNRVELTSEVILETKQIIKKETKDAAEAKASKIMEKVSEQRQDQFLATNVKPKPQLQLQQISLKQEQQLPKSTASIASLGDSLQNCVPPNDANREQLVQQPTVLNFSGGTNFFGGNKNGPAKSEGKSEALKFDTVANTVKTGTASNKFNFSKQSEADQHSPINFSFTAKSATENEGASSNIFNIASKGFIGFGQQTATNTNKGSLLNNSNNAIASPSIQSNNSQKAFNVGNTFSAFGDGAKTADAAAQNLTGLSIAPTSTANSTAVGKMQPTTTIFNKQNSNQNLGSSAISFADKSVNEFGKSAGNGTQMQNSTVDHKTHVFESEKTPIIYKNADAQCSSDADDVIKSLNICKPTVKETTQQAKDGNAFSFLPSNATNPEGIYQSGSDSKDSTKAAAAAVATSSSSPSSSLLCGKNGAASAPTLPSLDALSMNVPALGTAAQSTSFTLGTTDANKTVMNSATTVATTSAFTFTNSTLFKQMPTFQNQTTSSTVDSLISAQPTAVNAPATTEPVQTVGSTQTTGLPASSTAVSAVTTTTTSSIVSTAPATATGPPPQTSPTAGVVAPSTSVNNATIPLFSSIVTTKTPNDTLFGQTGQASQPPTAAAVSPTSPTSKSEVGTQQTASIFDSMSIGSTAPQPTRSGNIFGNTTSGFSSQSGSIFGGAAISSSANGSLFGNTVGTKSADVPQSVSIFGNAANAKASDGTASSIFANAAVKSPQSSAGSLFGGTGAKTSENANIFGSPTSPNNTAVNSGGTIFGQSALGQSSSSNIFAAAASKPETTSNASSFSFVGSAFGSNAKSSAATGGSLFGGVGATTDAQQQQSQSNAFGPQSGFGSATATSPFSGTFSQGGTPFANTGFGSPTQKPQPQTGLGAFSQPVFGGAPTFGSPPAFGAQPSFGGAATFGSPKGFGSFAAPAASPFSAPATQGSNIFETLGSADTGLSFGNLAQTTNNAANTPKPMFGGSSFMNYRA